MRQLLFEITIGLLVGILFAIAFFFMLSWFDQSTDAFGADLEPRYTCALVKVLDGDTVKVNCSDWPEPFQDTNLRIFGIDTPESIRGQAKCIKELKLGLNAKAWAKHEFEGAKVVAFTWARTKDKYGGRIDANVALPSGKSWADEAVRIGMARPYGINGNLKKSNWCK
jgi:endonuclease YncB( thermonuclease family)